MSVSGSIASLLDGSLRACQNCLLVHLSKWVDSLVLAHPGVTFVIDLHMAVVIVSDEHQIVDAVLQPQLLSQSRPHR